MKHKCQKGFTLIELMIVVSMIGILAALGMASFNRYIYETKVQERDVTTQRIIDNFEKFARWDNSAQVGDGFSSTGGVFNQATYLVAGWTPTWTSCTNNNGGKCTGTADWDKPVWKALKFGLTRQGRTSYHARIWENVTWKRLVLLTMSDLDGDCAPSQWSGCADYIYYDIRFYKRQNRFYKTKRYYSRD